MQPDIILPPVHCVTGEDTDRLTDHSAFQSASTYLCHGLLGKMLLFGTGLFYECLPMICVITEETEHVIRILFCTHFISLSSSLSRKPTDTM